MGDRGNPRSPRLSANTKLNIPVERSSPRDRGWGAPWSLGDREGAYFARQFEHGELSCRTPGNANVSHVYVPRSMERSPCAVLRVVNGRVSNRDGVWGT